MSTSIEIPADLTPLLRYHALQRFGNMAERLSDYAAAWAYCEPDAGELFAGARLSMDLCAKVLDRVGDDPHAPPEPVTVVIDDSRFARELAKLLTYTLEQVEYMRAEPSVHEGESETEKITRIDRELEGLAALWFKADGPELGFPREGEVA